MKEIINYEKTEPKIKLTKNTRGYGWEITMPKDPSGNYEYWVEQIKKIDTILREEFSIIDKNKTPEESK